MDDPGLDPVAHRHALRGLTRINRISRTTRILWRAITRFLPGAPQQPVRLLDVATGAGDIAIGLALQARRARLPFEVAAVDISAQALEHAREQAARAGAHVQFFPGDVLHEAIRDSYDIICCSLFLHHLDDDQALRLLRQMAARTRGLLLVNDLRRDWSSLLAAYLGPPLLTMSPVVRIDAVRSVRAARTIGELQVLVARAGLTDVVISRHWPARLLLEWRRPR
jgi:2-polyprenyl-3-methyl-5-hydroxy-6-metoxy-1,4-benzoquinol methylase